MHVLFHVGKRGECEREVGLGHEIFCLVGFERGLLGSCQLCGFGDEREDLDRISQDERIEHSEDM